jgi:hypothetical protein
MPSPAETIRTHRALENGAAFLALVALAAFIIAHVFLPLPLNQWIAGMACFTSDRVARGGPYYESPDGLCGATFPYPPGSLFLHHGLVTISGMGPLLAARLLSMALAVLYGILCVRAALRLGVSFGFAAASLALTIFVLSRHPTYGGGLTLSGDLVVLSVAMAIVLLAGALEQGRAAASVALLLALALFFKAQGASLYVGVGLFLVCRQRIVISRKLRTLVCIGAGLVAVTLFLFFMPNCWEACVGAMGRHPRSIARMLRELAASSYLWPFVVLPLALLVLHLQHCSLSRCWEGFQALSPSTAMMLCLTPPYVAIQVAAMMKNGGGPYDLDLAVLLTLPLIMLAGKLCSLDRWPVVLTVAVLAITGLSSSVHGSVQTIEQGNHLIEDARSYLDRKYPHARVLYSADQYCVLSKTSLVPETDVLTLWHFLTSGRHLEKVTTAVETQQYDLLIYPGVFTNSVLFEEFDKVLHERYEPLVDEEIPAYLRGGLFVRRPSSR